MDIYFNRETETTASIWWSGKRIGMITVDPGHGDILDQITALHQDLEEALCQVAQLELENSSPHPPHK